MKGRMDCKRTGGKVEAKPEEKESGEYRRGGRKPELKHGGAVKGEKPKMRPDRRARGGALSASSAKHPYSDGKSGPPVDRTPYKRGGAIHGEKEAEAEEDERASGGRLTTEERNALPEKTFALPGRRYPIPDASHGRNALARVSQHGTSEEKAKVRAAVHRKFPGIGEK